MVNMAVDLGGLKMRTPVTTASGTFGYGAEYAGMVESESGPVRELVNVQHADNIVYFTQNMRQIFFYIWQKSFLCPEKLLQAA